MMIQRLPTYYEGAVRLTTTLIPGRRSPTPTSRQYLKDSSDPIERIDSGNPEPSQP